MTGGSTKDSESAGDRYLHLASASGNFRNSFPKIYEFGAALLSHTQRRHAHSLPAANLILRVQPSFPRTFFEELSEKMSSGNSNRHLNVPGIDEAFETLECIEFAHGGNPKEHSDRLAAIDAPEKIFFLG